MATFIGLMLQFSAGCVGPVANLYPPADNAVVTIYIVRHTWHTGLVLSSTQLTSNVKELFTELPDYPYIEIGWGDEGFYQAKDITAWLAIKALFWPTDSVLHIVALPDTPEKVFTASETFKLTISRQGYENLLRYIEHAIYRDNDNQPLALGPGIYGHSRFFRANGNYHLFRTCNHWIANALRETGFPITPFYAATAGNVVSQVSDNVGEWVKCLSCAPS